MTKKISVGIIGGAGYTGGEMVRLLLNHPFAELDFVQSRSQANKRLDEVHRDIVGDTDLKFSAEFGNTVDVLFLCLSHGESQKFLTENTFPDETRIIDLGNDFRLGANSGNRSFVYGLPEYQRDKIISARNVANPGCFATAIQLGLLPLAKAGLLGEVHTTGITGSTGAGQKIQDTTHFTWRADNISAYKTLTHQHIGEINQTLKSLQSSFAGPVNFVPWRGNFTRGIFVSSTLETSLNHEQLTDLYRDFYQHHPFTHLSATMIDMKQVVNTNKCLIHLEKVGNKLVAHSIIDNLIKGASGQAIQNMNLMFGFEEESGLRLKGSVF